MAAEEQGAPLSGTRVVAIANGVAAAYAARMLCTLGAQVVLVEPPGGSPFAASLLSSLPQAGS
ncbi:CoA transferase [Novosphingobium panipatense]